MARLTETQLISRRWAALAAVLLGVAAVILVAMWFVAAAHRDNLVKAHEAAQTKEIRAIMDGGSR